MCFRVMRCLCALALGLFAAIPAIAEESGPSPLIFSPWTKSCLSATCFVGRDGRFDPECGPVVVAAVLIEKRGDATKTLRVTLPTGVHVERGVRIAIDQGEPVERPFAACYVSGCSVNYVGGVELIDRLKQGRMLVLEAVDKTGAPIRVSMPLDDFADAYDGEPQQPKVFEETATKLQAELDRRKTHCEAGK